MKTDGQKNGIDIYEWLKETLSDAPEDPISDSYEAYGDEDRLDVEEDDV